MMQADLLADVPRARNTDPGTSHIAAREVKDSGRLGQQQALVLDFVRRFPGHTSAELAERYARDTGEPWQKFRPMFGRRLGELRAWIRQGEARTCSVCGSASTTWWPR